MTITQIITIRQAGENKSKVQQVTQLKLAHINSDPCLSINQHLSEVIVESILL